MVSVFNIFRAGWHADHHLCKDRQCSKSNFNLLLYRMALRSSSVRGQTCLHSVFDLILSHFMTGWHAAGHLCRWLIHLTFVLSSRLLCAFPAPLHFTPNKKSLPTMHSRVITFTFLWIRWFHCSCIRFLRNQGPRATRRPISPDA